VDAPQHTGGRCRTCRRQITRNLRKHEYDCYLCKTCDRYYTDRGHSNRCEALEKKRSDNPEKYWQCEICGKMVERRLRHIREVHHLSGDEWRLRPEHQSTPEKQEQARKEAIKAKRRVNIFLSLHLLWLCFVQSKCFIKRAY
jgi:methionyl-tRNA synthetase